MIEKNTCPIVRSDVLLGDAEEVLQWSLSPCLDTQSKWGAAISLRLLKKSLYITIACLIYVTFLCRNSTRLH